jgi:hypothetical protein
MRDEKISSLSWEQWETLPISARVSDRIVDILLLASEIRAELETGEATPLRWLVPEIERVIVEADELLRLLAS